MTDHYSPAPGFSQVRQVEIPTLALTVVEYRHDRTGAVHYHLSAESDENVFLVAFRTMPMDSSGVAHILEHTSLCGSERYPVRDPFFMMTRRSLSTFMNAFTSGDWTAYPFASQNRNDFDNLLGVYLDAVFFPCLDPLDFAQEGIRVEFEEPGNPTSPLVYKGVVFNEMKGAMSSPVSTLFEALNKHLFPTTTYHYNSGGDPEHIPDLSYDDLVAFHRVHYHPSNAVFMTFGNIPAAEHQAKFEAQALQRFATALPKAIRGRDEKRYHAPIRVEEGYALDEDDASEQTHIVLGWLLGQTANLHERLEAELLSGVLLENSASPLRQWLETCGLGSAPSPLCGIDDSGRELSFLCGLEGSEPEQAQAVEDGVLAVLQQVAADGVPYEDVEAVLHQLELSQREIGGDSYPYGLQLILNGLGAVLHDGDPVGIWYVDPVLTELRERIQNPEFIKGLARKWLLDNNHRVRLTLRPEQSLSARRVAAEAERLARLRAQLSADDCARIVQGAEALAERQARKDDPEQLPRVGREDIPPELLIVDGEVQTLATATAPITLTRYGQGTNGLLYAQVVMDLPALAPELAELLPFYVHVVSELGAGERDYLAMQKWQSQVSGGLRMGWQARTALSDANGGAGHLVFGGKALVRKQGDFAALMEATLTGLRFDEQARLRELLSQFRVRWDNSITGQGHSYAMQAAQSGMSAVAAFQQQLHGLVGLRRLRALDDGAESPEAIAALAERLTQLHAIVLQSARQFLLIAEPAELPTIQNQWLAAWPQGGVVTPVPAHAFAAPSTTGDAYWVTNTQVYFCARAFPAVPVEHVDAAPLMVLGGFLRNGFLHRAIREQGGAYGGGAGYDGNACAFRFYSYRDPRFLDTLKDFEASVDWLLTEAHEERQLEEALLGIIADMDKPLSPAGEARQAFHNNLYGRTPEQRRRLRARLLAVTLDDLRRVGERYLRGAQPVTAVVGPQTGMELATGHGFAIERL